LGKTFITERDIEDMHRDGASSLHVNEDIVLTDLAREKAERLSIQLIKDAAQKQSPESCTACAPASSASTAHSTSYQDLKAQVKKAVIARVDPQVDATLLDNIIDRVAHRLGLI
jgi:hypothetical protein